MNLYLIRKLGNLFGRYGSLNQIKEGPFTVQAVHVKYLDLWYIRARKDGNRCWGDYHECKSRPIWATRDI